MRICLPVLLVFCLGLLGCGERASSSSDASEGPRYVTTIPPFEMIIAPLVEGRGTTVRLLDAGDSPHTYDPRPSDLRAVGSSRALIYGADALDGWASDMPAERTVSLMSLLPPSVHYPFGAESSGHGHEDTHEEGEGEHAHATTGLDPHFWTDPMAVKALVPVLADTLCGLDADGCATYRRNAASFADTLDALDARIRARLQPVEGTSVMLAQPFFRYFLRRYGMDVVDVVEAQPAKEPTPRHIHALVERVRTSGAAAILVQEQLPPRAARAVAEAGKLPVVSVDPLGGTTDRRTYVDLMTYNAETLRRALTAPVSDASSD